MSETSQFLRHTFRDRSVIFKVFVVVVCLVGFDSLGRKADVKSVQRFESIYSVFNLQEYA